MYAAIERIRETPEAFPVRSGIHRVLVRRFPYSVLYRVLPDECIRILVIRDHKRHPEYGTERR